MANRPLPGPVRRGHSGKQHQALKQQIEGIPCCTTASVKKCGAMWGLFGSKLNRGTKGAAYCEPLWSRKPFPPPFILLCKLMVCVCVCEQHANILHYFFGFSYLKHLTLAFPFLSEGTQDGLSSTDFNSRIMAIGCINNKLYLRDTQI